MKLRPLALRTHGRTHTHTDTHTENWHQVTKTKKNWERREKSSLRSLNTKIPRATLASLASRLIKKSQGWAPPISLVLNAKYVDAQLNSCVPSAKRQLRSPWVHNCSGGVYIWHWHFCIEKNVNFGQFWQKWVPQKWANVIFNDKNMFSIQK